MVWIFKSKQWVDKSFVSENVRYIASMLFSHLVLLLFYFILVTILFIFLFAVGFLYTYSSFNADNHIFIHVNN